MKKLEIFEPAMCCSTGLCGPGVDSELLRLSTLTNSLSKKGVKFNRYNLTSDPQKFVMNKVVNEQLTKEGPNCLPLSLLDGELVKSKSYPLNEEICEWLNIASDLLNEEKKSSFAGCCGGSGGC